MYKKSTILNFVEAQPYSTIRRQDLICFIVELNGMSYNSKLHRGYYSCALWPNQKGSGHLIRPSKKEPRFLTKVSRGKYMVTTIK